MAYRALKNQQDMQVIEKWWDRAIAELKNMGPTDRVVLFIERFTKELGYWSVQPWRYMSQRNEKGYVLHDPCHRPPAAPYAMQRAYTHAVGPDESPAEIQMDLELPKNVDLIPALHVAHSCRVGFSSF